MVHKPAIILFASALSCCLVGHLAAEPEHGLSLKTEDEILLVAADRGYLGYVIRYEEDHEGRGRMRVVDIHSGSPAEKAGLLKNDLITSINGKSFQFANDLDMIKGLDWIKSGAELKLTILRGTNEIKKTLTATGMSTERRKLLAAWIESAEIWYQEGEGERCRARKAAAQKAKP